MEITRSFFLYYHEYKNYQSYITLFIAVLSSIVSFKGFDSESKHSLFNSIMIVYFFIDFTFLPKMDMVIHHILSLTLFISERNLPLSFQNYSFLILLKTEISTIFLSIMNIEKRNKHTNIFLRNCNQLAFLTTFFYYRIISLSNVLFLDKKFYKINLENYFSIDNTGFLYWISYFATVSLLCLNLFWACKIIKIIIKKQKNK